MHSTNKSWDRRPTVSATSSNSGPPPKQSTLSAGQRPYPGDTSPPAKNVRSNHKWSRVAGCPPQSDTSSTALAPQSLAKRPSLSANASTSPAPQEIPPCIPPATAPSPEQSPAATLRLYASPAPAAVARPPSKQRGSQFLRATGAERVADFLPRRSPRSTDASAPRCTEAPLPAT